MEDNSFLYAALQSEFERRLARLEEGTYAVFSPVPDAYGL